MSASTAQVASAIFSLARKAYRKDRANRYALLKPWTLPPLMRALPRYDGVHVLFEPLGDGRRTAVTIKPFAGEDNVCDGANYFPDSPRGVVAAAIAHDPLYAEIPAIASTWQWPEGKVRELADEILSTVMVRERSNKLIARVVFNGVWYLGGAYRWAKSILPAAVLALAVSTLAGCSGCLSPPDLSDPDAPYTSPVYKKTASVLQPLGNYDAPSVILSCSSSVR
jgi:hypothetical protein